MVTDSCVEFGTGRTRVTGKEKGERSAHNKLPITELCTEGCNTPCRVNEAIEDMLDVNCTVWRLIHRVQDLRRFLGEIYNKDVLLTDLLAMDGYM